MTNPSGALDLLIKNAVIVTADADHSVIWGGSLAVRSGRIDKVGPMDELAALEPTAKRIVDAGGMVLMPGIINTHCHAADSLFRGLVEDLPLEAWLQKVWKAESAVLTPETTRLGATLGFAELLLSGVTTVMDMFWYPRQSVHAAEDVGVRLSTGGIFFDGAGVDGQTHEDRLAEAKGFFQDFGGRDDVLPAILPHGTYTVSPEHLREARAIADEHGGLFCTHAAETRAEQADIQNRYGRSIIRHLDHHGLLDDRTVLAHCVHLDDEEIDILARTGATVSHNPMSNLKLGSGIARIPDLINTGVRVTLGTDGAISGNDLDMWLALRLAATLHKGTRMQADIVTETEAFDMVTREGANALGAGDRLGSLEEGKLADMALVDVDRPHAVPMFDPTTHLVYSTSKADVRHVFVGGEQVVQDGALIRLDLTETLAKTRELIPAIKASQA